MDHAILNRIQAEGFAVLGWSWPRGEGLTKTRLLIGNAGPAMFRRFAREDGDNLDRWTKRVVDPLAETLGAKAVYPFDQPYQPFQQWARESGAIHQSPLGLNIHATYGLWHAYRAALLFPVELDLPRPAPSISPCASCEEKPCLKACPVSAFDGHNYDVEACANHLHQQNSCMNGGCLARRACPMGKEFQYEKPQMQFHMRAFKAAHPA